MMKKIIASFIILPAVLGVLGLILGSIYGGNYGCFEFMGLYGYESCGIFSASIGILIGVLACLVILDIYKKKSY